MDFNVIRLISECEMDLKKIFLKFACNQKKFERKLILLVDNTFNDLAELIDNYALFEYLQSCPEYKDISYYIINRNNVQYAQIAAKYPHNIITVKDNKFSWPLLFKLVTTKYWLDSYQVIFRFDKDAYMRQGDITTVYMQHGINYFKPGFWGHLSISPKYFNKIVFSNKKEQQIFKKYYGYDDKNVIMAGLSRWDWMKEKTGEKIIFAYFTFRSYLIRVKGVELTETRYYKNIVAFLSSPQLKELCEKHNVKLYAGIHHQMIRDNDIREKLYHINFIEDKDIGEIKQKASMLITDFSSMCFDFMLRDKPVVFFHVDAGDPLNKLLPDSAENDANVESKNKELYNIYYSVKGVIGAIKKYVNNGFELEDQYKKINSKFFTYRRNIRKHFMQKLMESPLDVENVLPPAKKPKIMVTRYKLLGFLTLLKGVHRGCRTRYKLFGILPFFSVLKKKNKITTKYYLFGLPVMKISKKECKIIKKDKDEKA